MSTSSSRVEDGASARCRAGSPVPRRAPRSAGRARGTGRRVSATRTVPESQATGRQRRLGRWPSGKSRNRNVPVTPDGGRPDAVGDRGGHRRARQRARDRRPGRTWRSRPPSAADAPERRRPPAAASRRCCGAGGAGSAARRGGTGQHDQERRPPSASPRRSTGAGSASMTIAGPRASRPRRTTSTPTPGRRSVRSDQAAHGRLRAPGSQRTTCVGWTVSRTAAQQVGADGVEVDLVPQPARELVQGPGGVVPAAVEAAVDQGLDPAAGRPEQRGDRQGGAGDGEVGLARSAGRSTSWSSSTEPR